MKRGMQNVRRRLSGGKPMESGTYPAATQADEVTLVVYGWHNVQPGTLSWVFPSFAAAMRAASVLRNATQWAILGGRDASGSVLAEKTA